MYVQKEIILQHDFQKFPKNNNIIFRVSIFWGKPLRKRKLFPNIIEISPGIEFTISQIVATTWFQRIRSYVEIPSPPSPLLTNRILVPDR